MLLLYHELAGTHFINTLIYKKGYLLQISQIIRHIYDLV